MSFYPSVFTMPRYLEVLAALHKIRRPRTYLEIGVADGRALQLAGDSTTCIGVDPEPRIATPMRQGCSVERATSDEFFAGDLPEKHLGSLPLDLAFIDGMHLFEYALRDFINIENRSDRRTLVVIHDLLPDSEVTAARDRRSSRWTGDVWKLLLILRDHRPDLRISLLDTPPSGLGLVEGLDAGNSVLSSSYGELVGEYGELDFADWQTRGQEIVPMLLGSRESRRWRRRVMRRLRLDARNRRIRHLLGSLRRAIP